MKNNILVIGNGFDLQHHLATKYSDFISFVVKGNYKNKNKEIENEIEELMNDACYLQLIKNESNMKIDFWTDLEELLSQIIKCTENFFTDISNYIKKDNRINQRKLNGLIRLVIRYFKIVDINSGMIDNRYFSVDYGTDWKALKLMMSIELKKLKRSLVIYLKYYVQDNEGLDFQQIFDINPNYIITYNYTNYYEKYDFDCLVSHVHGSLEKENIVLGHEDNNVKNLRFIEYKKYYQIITNKADSIIINNIKDENGKEIRPTAHFYGLSLDKKDGETITKIYNACVKNIIYYYEDATNEIPDYDQKVANLIGILGKDRVLEDIHSGKIELKKISNAIWH